MSEIIALVVGGIEEALQLLEAPWVILGVSLLIFLSFYLLRKRVTKIIFYVILKVFPHMKKEVYGNLYSSFAPPLHFLIIGIGLYFSLMYLPITEDQEERVITFFRSSIIIILAWGFHNITGIYSIFFENLGSRFKINIDDILLPFLSRFVRFIIIALAITVLAQEWGFDINGFIAGLGIGGLAIALAAQDTIANFFGGIVIITEKPFSVGDWVQTPSVEGTVEDISFRSTKVRTFAHALVTVPNSVLVKEAITNWTRMGKRRVHFHLGVTYTTSRVKLEKCVKSIRGMLEEHPDVHKETIMTRFDKFGESSLDIFLYYFTVTTTWAEYLEVKEDTNFKIMDILEQEGVEVAFPSRSVYFENPVELERVIREEIFPNPEEETPLGEGKSPEQ